MKLEKYFCWKVLSRDGLLKDHDPTGPYYDQTTYTDSFNTEQDAVDALTRWQNTNDCMEREMVLITTYYKAYE